MPGPNGVTVFTQTSAGKKGTYTCTRLYVEIHTYTRRERRTYTFTEKYNLIPTHIQTHRYIYKRTDTYTYAQMHIQTHRYIHLETHSHNWYDIKAPSKRYMHCRLWLHAWRFIKFQCKKLIKTQTTYCSCFRKSNLYRDKSWSSLWRRGIILIRIKSHSLLRLFCSVNR